MSQDFRFSYPVRCIWQDLVSSYHHLWTGMVWKIICGQVWSEKSSVDRYQVWKIYWAYRHVLTIWTRIHLKQVLKCIMYIWRIPKTLSTSEIIWNCLTWPIYIYNQTCWNILSLVKIEYKSLRQKSNRHSQVMLPLFVSIVKGMNEFWSKSFVLHYVQ